MDYQLIQKHISADNQDLLKFINKDEIKWLDKHFMFINGLLMGRIKPFEKKYESFIDVIKNKKEPTTKPEKIYLKFAKYYEDQVKKTQIKGKDPNIMYDGVEINPMGLRPGTDKVNIKYEPEGPDWSWKWGW